MGDGGRGVGPLRLLLLVLLLLQQPRPWKMEEILGVGVVVRDTSEAGCLSACVRWYLRCGGGVGGLSGGECVRVVRADRVRLHEDRVCRAGPPAGLLYNGRPPPPRGRIIDPPLLPRRAQPDALQEGGG